MKTVVGLYDDLEDARDVVEDLVDEGINRSDISLLMRDPNEEYATALESTDTEAEVADAAVDGAVAGGVIGGLAGVVLGLGAFAIPGLGPVVAAGPIVSGLIGAGIGAASGSLLAALVEWGIEETDAEYYAEGLRRGGTLVAVKATDADVEDVVDIMNERGPVDLGRRSAYWRASGWTGYDKEADPYTADQIDEIRSVRAETYDDFDYDDYNAYDSTFRQHYQTAYGTTGRSYDTYEPAYRYGYTLAMDDDYADRDWDDFEADARAGWEDEAEGAWNDFKDAVRHAWEEVTEAFDFDDEDEDDFDFDLDEDEDYDVVNADETETFEIAEEEMRVGKRQVQRGGVRVHKWVETEPVEENVTLREEHVTVNRRSVDRPADDADFDMEEETFEVTETAEEVVTEKRARVVEEVTIGKTAKQHTETVRDSVRHTHVEIEELDTDIDADDYGRYDANYRQHYNRAFGRTDYDYNQYKPAYRYGYTLASDDRYSDYDWADVEPAARRHWEDEHDGAWEDFKDAVRHAWNEAKDAVS